MPPNRPDRTRWSRAAPRHVELTAVERAAVAGVVAREQQRALDADARAALRRLLAPPGRARESGA